MYTLIELAEPGIDGYEDFEKHRNALKTHAGSIYTDDLIDAVIDVCDNLDVNSKFEGKAIMGGFAYGHATLTTKGANYACRKVLSGAFAALENADMYQGIASAIDGIV